MQALSIAAAGLQSATARFDASARRMAEQPLERLPEEAVEQIAATADFKANLAVIRTADEMTGALLDILA